MPALATWVLLLLAVVQDCSASCITKLPSNAVALTFDACETVTPSYFDDSILGFLLAEKIPFTLFVSGKFAQRNRDRLRELSGLDFVEIENHSYQHILHMERLSDDAVRREVSENEKIIQDITGRRTRFFRFPGGNDNDRVLHVVESMHYRVVHWTFESGDPDRRETPEILARRVLEKTRPGSILIFHINGRGWSTGQALPSIVRELKNRGYTFVKIEDALGTK